MLNAQASHPTKGKLLGGRYYILEILSFGVMGRTYLAQDIRQPGSPKCIIKHFNLVSDEPNCLETVKGLFLDELQILKHLGQHEQIPQVLAEFENNQGFYLVQEFIPGQPLSDLLPTSTRCGQRWTEPQLIQFLQEVLAILEFIHAQNIIHCNINPSSIIKRAEDGKLCLIDFAAVQPVQPRLDLMLNLIPAGYIPPEQLAFQPRPNSDIYALGTMAIQALTGMRPTQLQIVNENIMWQQEASVSDELAAILNQMVELDYKKRYQNVGEVLRSLQDIPAKEDREATPEQPSLNLVQTPQASELILPSFEFELTEFTENLPISLLPIPLPPIEFDPDQEIHLPGISPVLIMLSLSLAALGANYVFIEAGIHDIVQPDPKQFKLVKPQIKEEQLLTWSEELCKIPYLCFFQGLPLSEREVYLLRKQAYAQAYQGNFTKALKYLEKVTPSSPHYDNVKIKIAEYRKKQAIKNSKMGIAANPNNKR